MKILKTASFNKLSKEWDVNPWAVCTDSVGRKDSEKYERCVQQVKEQDEIKPIKKPKNYREPWDPQIDFDDRLNDELSGYTKQKKNDALDDEWKKLVEKHKKEQPVFAKNTIGVVRAGDYKRRIKKVGNISGRNPQWRTGRVFTQAPGFGPGKEIEEQRIITIRPEENEAMALKREGFDPLKSRIEIIDM